MTCCSNLWAVQPQAGGCVRVVIDRELPAVACLADNQELTHGGDWIVETQDGLFVGRVTLFASPLVRVPRLTTGRLLRHASEQDFLRAKDLELQEREIESYLRRRIRELAIDLRPLKVRLPLAGRKALVFYTAEQRVDFRPLLKELGRRFRRRVEMRPLGVRDGARLAGGIGPCGRTLCCATFMDRFHSVTVRMAKRQNLSLNPTKISGLCSRLMCCLAYEVEQYPTSRRREEPPKGEDDGGEMTAP